MIRAVQCRRFACESARAPPSPVDGERDAAQAWIGLREQPRQCRRIDSAREEHPGSALVDTVRRRRLAERIAQPLASFLPRHRSRRSEDVLEPVVGGRPIDPTGPNANEVSGFERADVGRTTHEGVSVAPEAVRDLPRRRGHGHDPAEVEARQRGACTSDAKPTRPPDSARYSGLIPSGSRASRSSRASSSQSPTANMPRSLSNTRTPHAR